MFHTVAYQVSLANTADTDLAAITDSIELIQNNHIVPQVDKQLLYAYITAVTLIRGKIITPKIRQMSAIQIRPIDNAIGPTSRTPISDYRHSAPVLRGLEEIQVQATDSAAGPNTCTAILGLAVGGIQPMPQGDIYTIRGTGTTTQTANAWTQAAITWADTLPQGNYACVGLSAVAATGIAARLIFDQQVMRPGAVIGATDVIIPHPMFLKGGLGIWGYFNSYRMPNIEFLSTSADTAQEVFLDFVRIS